MKLVIDISENQYEIAKEFIETVDDKSPLANAIVNGIPYETVTEFVDRCRECGREKVLDKIRAEIEQEPYVSKMAVLDIIDEYKAESEGEEWKKNFQMR